MSDHVKQLEDTEELYKISAGNQTPVPEDPSANLAHIFLHVYPKNNLDTVVF